MSSQNKDSRKTASGHSSGLQSSQKFRENEEEIKASRGSKQNMDPTLSGENAETVYRDRRGKKLDMLSEFMRQQASREGKAYKLEQAQYSWGLGTVQKLQEDARKKELLEISSEPFARTTEDPRLEAMRKDEIRDGDPMAAYFQSKKSKRLESVDDDNHRQVHSSRDHISGSPKNLSLIPTESKTKLKKPLYKGPLALPNRFKIMPGYRWDGIDRGNQFEHKLLTKLSDKVSYREDEYKYLSSDL